LKSLANEVVKVVIGTEVDMVTKFLDSPKFEPCVLEANGNKKRRAKQIFPIFLNLIF
jgi:hypothetical protein